MDDRIETPVAREDLPAWAAWQVALTDHPIVSTGGVYRYKVNRLIRWTIDHGLSLNDMWLAYEQGAFSRDEFVQFYRDLGYSLNGFDEIWGDILTGEDEDI